MSVSRTLGKEAAKSTDEPGSADRSSTDTSSVQSKMGIQKNGGICLCDYVDLFWSSDTMDLCMYRKLPSSNSFIHPISLVLQKLAKGFPTDVKNWASWIEKQNSSTYPFKCSLTSVSRNLRSALFFLMLLRRTYTANVRPRMTMMKRPPITPAAIRGVLAIRITDFIFR